MLPGVSMKASARMIEAPCRHDGLVLRQTPCSKLERALRSLLQSTPDYFPALDPKILLSISANRELTAVASFHENSRLNLAGRPPMRLLLGPSKLLHVHH
eukprot:scaffold163673_cov19-Tisochrysis_lutea.AAC.1